MTFDEWWDGQTELAKSCVDKPSAKVGWDAAKKDDEPILLERADPAAPDGDFCGTGRPKSYGHPVRGHVAEVLLQRRRGGCCERYADNMACDCFAEARLKDATESRPWHEEVADRIASSYQCQICGNPNCDNPGGKH